MLSLADRPELVGFFSYSREDDADSKGALSALRDRIQRELSSQLGRSSRNFRLWQDKEAIAPGTLWESEITNAIEQSVFFIPIVTPRAVGSPHCRFEFESFLARERALGRSDLVFPILYIRVRALEDDALARASPVLSIIKARQYVDWRDLRHLDIDATRLRETVAHFCEKIADALLRPDPLETEREEQRQRQEAAAAGNADACRRDFEPFRDAPFAPELVALPAGEFWMGSPEGEEGRFDDEGPRHKVRIEHRFAIGRYPVTFAEYDRFCDARRRKKPDDEGWGRGRRPVINVSWQDAQAYVEWLSRETRLSPGGRAYRLPSEAEWEYACRAGTQTRYSFGDAITPKDANYRDSRLGHTSEVGSYPENPWHLHDMHGNVWEWVADDWHDSYSHEDRPDDGSAWVDKGSRHARGCVLRGGSWYSGSRHCRSAFRYWNGADVRVNSVGFRVARTLITS